MSTQRLNQLTTQITVEPPGRKRREHSDRLQTSTFGERRSLEVASANATGSSFGPNGFLLRVTSLPAVDSIVGIHGFTFNDIDATLRWRRELLSNLCGS